MPATCYVTFVSSRKVRNSLEMVEMKIHFRLYYFGRAVVKFRYLNNHLKQINTGTDYRWTPAQIMY